MAGVHEMYKVSIKTIKTRNKNKKQTKQEIEQMLHPPSLVVSDQILAKPREQKQECVIMESYNL